MLALTALLTGIAHRMRAKRRLALLVLGILLAVGPGAYGVAISLMHKADGMGVTKRTRIALAATAVLAVLVLDPLLVPMLIPLSPINMHIVVDINIRTGRVRRSRCMWYVCVSSAVENTAISRALDSSTIDVEDIEPWHRVLTLAPWSAHSPHYIFHSAIHQARQLELLIAIHDLNAKGSREIAARILTLWQQKESDSAAGEYLATLAYGNGNKMVGTGANENAADSTDADP